MEMITTANMLQILYYNLIKYYFLHKHLLLYLSSITIQLKTIFNLPFPKTKLNYIPFCGTLKRYRI